MNLETILYLKCKIYKMSLKKDISQAVAKRKFLTRFQQLLLLIRVPPPVGI